MLPLKTLDSTNLKYLTEHFLCAFISDVDIVLIWSFKQSPNIYVLT